jgi:pyruvate kinase
MQAVDHARKLLLVRPGDKVVAMYNVEKRCAVVRVIEIPPECDPDCVDEACDVECQLDENFLTPGSGDQD